MRLLTWIWRAALFFALFAFALNNQEEVVVRWFFGAHWRAPLVFVVLAAFALGCAFGALAMVPSWWRQRRVARRQAGDAPSAAADSPARENPGTEPPPLHPPREGL